MAEQVEEEVIEIKEVAVEDVIVALTPTTTTTTTTTTSTTTTTIPETVTEVVDIDVSTEDVISGVVEIFTEEEEPELTEEELAIEVEELEEVVDVPIVEEDATEEQVEEAIEEYVEELDNEELVEVIEEVNDIGVENLSEVSEEVIEVVSQVVEEAVDSIEELTETQVEAVAEVLGVEKEDVKIVAELAQDDEAVAQAVDEFVERAVANADDSSQEYTFADSITEVQLEAFIENPIQELTDIDFSDVGNVAEIGNDMTQDQKDKAKEVVVPVIIASQIIATSSIIPIRKIK